MCEGLCSLAHPVGSLVLTLFVMVGASPPHQVYHVEALFETFCREQFRSHCACQGRARFCKYLSRLTPLGQPPNMSDISQKESVDVRYFGGRWVWRLSGRMGSNTPLNCNGTADICTSFIQLHKQTVCSGRR